LIRTETASLTYWDHGRAIKACDQISLAIRKDEFVGILGPSGSGKSSLLYLLSGLKDPTAGVVFYDEQPYAQRPPDERAAIRLNAFGFVFQQPFLIGFLTALENVMCANGSRHEHRARKLLESLGLQDKMNRLPSDLSGGEKQRVCIARALLHEPKVVFADEPTASLDHETGTQVVEMLVRNRNGALVMVTHDESMLTQADRVLRIHEGRLQESS